MELWTDAISMQVLPNRVKKTLNFVIKSLLKRHQKPPQLIIDRLARMNPVDVNDTRVGK